MKTCARCRELKPETDFYWKIRSKGQRQSRCIDCLKELKGAKPKRWMLSDAPRQCTVCRELKPASDFNFKNQKTLRRQSCCRGCEQDQHSITARRSTLRQYGLTIETWQVLVDQQDGCCAVCRKPGGTAGHERLYVDHDHDTKAVRGLLCMNCNSAIGHFRDNPSLLRRAAVYLEIHSARGVA